MNEITVKEVGEMTNYQVAALINKQDAELKAAGELIERVEDKIKSLAVAHNMSHTNMCDELTWKDDFAQTYKDSIVEIQQFRKLTNNDKGE